MMVLGCTGSPNSVLNFPRKVPRRGCCFLIAATRKSSGATKAKPSTSIGNLTWRFGRLNIGAQSGSTFARAGVFAGRISELWFVPGVSCKTHHRLVADKFKSFAGRQIGSLVDLFGWFEEIDPLQVSANCRNFRGVEPDRQLGVSESVAGVADEPKVFVRHGADDPQGGGESDLA